MNVTLILKRGTYLTANATRRNKSTIKHAIHEIKKNRPKNLPFFSFGVNLEFLFLNEISLESKCIFVYLIIHHDIANKYQLQ